jgi:PhnB protein
MFAHGQLVYLQIPATDITTSARFYERVLGWEVDPPESGFEAPGLIGQWIIDRPPAPDAGPVMWIHVDDLAQTLSAAEQAGATLEQPPTPDGPRELASFRDPAANLVGIAAHGGDHPARSSSAARRVDNRTMPPCTLIHQLVYDDVTEARRWLCDAFGFTERWHVGDHRAQLSLGDSTIAITEPRHSRVLVGPVSLLVRVDDADALRDRALAHGATLLSETRDFAYGERQCTVEDPGGHHWCLTQSIADVDPETWGGTSGPALGTRPSSGRSAGASPRISVMLIVPDGARAVRWYYDALGAEVLWDLGGVAGLQVGGAPFFLHEANPDNPAEDSPDRVGQTSVRIEVFVDDPDGFIERATRAGATPGSPVTAHEMPWGTHRQGGFTDPFGHRWSVGDAGPLDADVH